MRWPIPRGGRCCGRWRGESGTSGRWRHRSRCLAAASKHVRVLEGAGLLRRRVDGRTHLCRLEAGPLAAADAWLRFYEGFWTDRLDALAALLRSEAAGDEGEAG